MTELFQNISEPCPVSLATYNYLFNDGFSFSYMTMLRVFFGYKVGFNMKENEIIGN